MIPVFLGSDILMEQSLENGAIHIIERRCRLAIDAPYLLKKVLAVFFQTCFKSKDYVATIVDTRIERIWFGNWCWSCAVVIDLLLSTPCAHWYIRQTAEYSIVAHLWLAPQLPSREAAWSSSVSVSAMSDVSCGWWYLRVVLAFFFICDHALLFNLQNYEM